MLSFEDFINDNQKVLLANSNFIFEIKKDRTFFKEILKERYNSNNIEYNEKNDSRDVVNPFSNVEILKASSKHFSYIEEKNKIFYENLIRLHLKKNLKREFLHYSLQGHMTSVFINYDKKFVVYYNSNSIVYKQSIIEDTILYLKAIGKDIDTYKLFLVSSGKQTLNPFCFIYSYIFLIKLLEEKNTKKLDNPKNVIDICNKITKKEICELFYKVYILNNECYKKNEDFIERLGNNEIKDLKKENFGFNYLSCIRNYYNELSSSSCKNVTNYNIKNNCKELSLKKPASVIEVVIKFNNIKNTKCCKNEVEVIYDGIEYNYLTQIFKIKTIVESYARK